MLQGFLKSARTSPEKPAIIVDDKEYTYGQLLKIVYGIYSDIKTAGFEQASFIGVYTDYSVHTYASILAVLMNGSGFVPLNKKFPENKLQNIIKSAGIGLMLCNAGSAGELSEFKEEQSVILLENDRAGHENTMLPAEIKESTDLSEFAYILFTSGSTGVPKGIAITRANFAAFTKAMMAQYDFNASDKVLQIFELSFDVSIACTFLAWEAGACLVPTPTEGIVFIRALEIIKEHHVTVVSMAPSALAYMKQLRLLEEFDFPAVRYTFLTGEALPYKLALAWKETAKNSIIENAYGPTEVTVWSSMYTLNEQTSGETINGLVPIGKVLPGLSYLVCDEHLKPVKKGEFGELLLMGGQVAKGYWNDPDKTASTFVQVPDQPGIWYKTGDIVVENEHGHIVYVNRKDNQVQINGFRVELGEIEFRIKEYTKKDSAVVLPFENENNTLTLLAFIENIDDTLPALKAHLSATLPVYMVPKKYYSVGAMPLNNSGKIDRKKLLEMHSEE